MRTGTAKNNWVPAADLDWFWLIEFPQPQVSYQFQEVVCYVQLFIIEVLNLDPNDPDLSRRGELRQKVTGWHYHALELTNMTNEDPLSVSSKLSISSRFGDVDRANLCDFKAWSKVWKVQTFLCCSSYRDRTEMSKIIYWLTTTVRPQAECNGCKQAQFWSAKTWAHHAVDSTGRTDGGGVGIRLSRLNYFNRIIVYRLNCPRHASAFWNGKQQVGRPFMSS